MLKKSLKYLTIALLNVILLTVLMFSWADKLEEIFNPGASFWELLKIIGIGLVTLIAMRILVSYFRSKNIVNTTSKITISILLTLLISSYLYFDYSSKINKNVFTNGKFRKQIADKIEPSDNMSGSKGENLTFVEYQGLINLYGGFPKLPSEASNIKYSYEHDGFLPDYLFVLTYDLPKHMNVDTLNQDEGEFSRFQSFVVVDSKKRVTYTESLK